MRDGNCTPHKFQWSRHRPLWAQLTSWQICENYFLFIVLKAMLSLMLRPRCVACPSSPPALRICCPCPAITLSCSRCGCHPPLPIFLCLFLNIVVVVVFIICSTYTSRKSTLECVCVPACVPVCVCQCCRCPLPKIHDEQLLFSHHNHKRYKHNYYFYVPALIVKQQIACLGPTCA